MCRTIEEDFFVQPAVAGLLRAGFVEARLHTDGKSRFMPRIEELQDSLAGVPANPVYVVLDPGDERVLGKVMGGRKEALRALLEETAPGS